MTTKEAAHQWRLLQAQRIQDVFKEKHGRPATDIKELDKWFGSPAGQGAGALCQKAGGGWMTSRGLGVVSCLACTFFFKSLWKARITPKFHDSLPFLKS